MPTPAARMGAPTILRTSRIKSWRGVLPLARPLVMIFDQPPSNVSWNQEPPRQHSSKYLEERARTWAKKKAQVGTGLWDGTVITVREVSVAQGDFSIRVSHCQYSDIVYKQSVWASMPSRSRLRSFEAHVFGAVIPILPSRKALLGVIGPGTLQDQGHVDIIGGSLNVDERDFNSLEDVESHTLEELREEAGLVPERTSLMAFCYHGGAAFFLYRACVSNEDRAEPTSAELHALLAVSLDTFDVGSRSVTPDLALIQQAAKSLRPYWNG